mmetsp:Transcript_127415/g.271647  ORF Transcript_127415/g.271647 Transcript_127415/m.271647 type:complete len:520 (-) Transcript_127415:12-1571(-)
MRRQAEESPFKEALFGLKDGADSFAMAIADYRRDFDFVLRAITIDEQAMLYADKDLVSKRDFALEAVRRNPMVLRFLPEKLRGDRLVVSAAAIVEPSVLKWASQELRNDRALVEEVSEQHERASERLGCYEGETLRIVGPFNSWSVVDTECRLRKVPNSQNCDGASVHQRRGKSVEVPRLDLPAPELVVGATRHRLVALLPTGNISFQIVSCRQDFAFRIYPLETCRDEPLRLVVGNPRAVPAVVGGKEDGKGLAFHIADQIGALVSIYVDIFNDASVQSGLKIRDAGVAGTRRCAAVWYVFETRPARKGKAIALDDQGTASNTACKKHFRSEQALLRLEVIADVDSYAKLEPFASKSIIRQACDISSESCPENAMSTWDGGDGMKLSVVLDAVRGSVLGYCTYSMTEPGYMYLEQLAVAVRQQGKGLGRILVRKVVEVAREWRYKVVKVWSARSACDFYAKLGFVACSDAGTTPVPLADMVAAQSVVSMALVLRPSRAVCTAAPESASESIWMDPGDH